MTKSEMINIISEEERYLWIELKSNMNELGYSHPATNALRNQWIAIDRLIEKLKIRKESRKCTDCQNLI